MLERISPEEIATAYLSDGTYAIAQAQLEADLLKVLEIKREMIEEIEEQMCPERCDASTERYYLDYLWLGDEDWQALKAKYLEEK